jgi:hypothetical protein
MNRRHLLAALGLLGGLAACADFSELDRAARERIRGDAPPPALAPVAGLGSAAAAPGVTAAETAALQARAAALQARGAALAGPVGDPATVARLTARAACAAAAEARAAASSDPSSDPLPDAEGCVASPGATR